MCKKNKVDIPEKLENELPYKPYKCGIICTFLVHLGFLVALILFYMFSDKFALTEILGVSFLIVFFLMTICSFIFFIIVTLKDDQGIRFAKLNELVRISEKLKGISGVSNSIIETSSSENINQNTSIETKNYNYELYKKYMDTLVDI